MKDTLLKSSQPLPIRLASDLVGIKYINNGTDLNGFDCWGLVWYFYKQLGVETPKPTDYLTRTTNKKKNEMASVLKEKHWKPIENPQDHCVVAFERSQLTIHMGIYFPEIKRVLHAVGEGGVICEDLKTAERTRGIKAKFYQWH